MRWRLDLGNYILGKVWLFFSLFFLKNRKKKATNESPPIHLTNHIRDVPGFWNRLKRGSSKKVQNESVPYGINALELVLCRRPVLLGRAAQSCFFFSLGKKLLEAEAAVVVLALQKRTLFWGFWEDTELGNLWVKEQCGVGLFHTENKEDFLNILQVDLKPGNSSGRRCIWLYSLIWVN